MRVFEPSKVHNSQQNTLNEYIDAYEEKLDIQESLEEIVP
jgi:hypothetical protein